MTLGLIQYVLGGKYMGTAGLVPPTANSPAEYERAKGQAIRYVSIGGMAGLKEDPSDGLAEFKRGWANDKRTAHLCGRVFNRQKYEKLCQQKRTPGADFFPAYRAGEKSNRNAI